MIDTGKSNFLASHYEYIVAGVGLVALAGAALFYFSESSVDPNEAASSEAAQIERRMPKQTGVDAIDMTEFQLTTGKAKNPPFIREIVETNASFLASERRVTCKKCKKGMPGDVKDECPYCGEKLEKPKAVVLDADSDGLPDVWEKKFGLNPNDANDASADKDGDGFTNMEEYLAKTDPADGNSHPDYLDSLKVQLPLKQTYLPFVFRRALKVPNGWKLDFFDPSGTDDYGRKGATIRALVGDKIGASGYTLKKFEQKEKKVAIKGGEGLTKRVDVSEATVERDKDGKQVVLQIVESKRDFKLAPIDVQATLVYSRGATKTFDVVKGSQFDLNGTKFKVISINEKTNGAAVTVENVATGKKRTLEQ